MFSVIHLKEAEPGGVSLNCLFNLTYRPISAVQACSACAY